MSCASNEGLSSWWVAVTNELIMSSLYNGVCVRVDCSYTLRCTITDDWGKVRLAFDLEVVKVIVHKIRLTGVYRKRVKGDAWHYKKLCEDILAVAYKTTHADDDADAIGVAS